MSVRMPGFRGKGGFLVGNSLGIDRHGTNNRRHHVDKRVSEEMLRQLADRKRRRIRLLPSSCRSRAQHMGIGKLRSYILSVVFVGVVLVGSLGDSYLKSCTKSSEQALVLGFSLARDWDGRHAGYASLSSYDKMLVLL